MTRVILTESQLRYIIRESMSNINADKDYSDEARDFIENMLASGNLEQASTEDLLQLLDYAGYFLDPYRLMDIEDFNGELPQDEEADMARLREMCGQVENILQSRGVEIPVY